MGLAFGLPPMVSKVACNSTIQSRQAATVSVITMQQRLCNEELCVMLHSGPLGLHLGDVGPVSGLPPAVFKVAYNSVVQSTQALNSSWRLC